MEVVLQHFPAFFQHFPAFLQSCLAFTSSLKQFWLILKHFGAFFQQGDAVFYNFLALVVAFLQQVSKAAMKSILSRLFYHRILDKECFTKWFSTKNVLTRDSGMQLGGGCRIV